jgi:hypothetical protein
MRPMRVKKEYFVLAVLILGLSLYIMMRNPNKIHFQLPELSKVSNEEITKIEISTKERSILLGKNDNSWYILPQKYLVSKYQISKILETIEGLTLTALVSESKNYKRYALDDDNKTLVKAWAGDNLKREFEVGKITGENYSHTFVKLGGDYRVYHAQGNLKSRLSQTVDTLRDKTVLSFDKSEIRELSISKDEHSLVLSRNQVDMGGDSDQGNKGNTEVVTVSQTIWQSAEGKKADNPTVNGLLAKLSTLRCSEYIDGRKKEDFTDPIYTVQLKGSKGYTLSVFERVDENANTYPAISSQNDYPFNLPIWLAEEIMKSPEEILGVATDSKEK